MPIGTSATANLFAPPTVLGLSGIGGLPAFGQADMADLARRARPTVAGAGIGSRNDFAPTHVDMSGFDAPPAPAPASADVSKIGVGTPFHAPTVWDRVGSALGGPDMSGALLRAGTTMLSGGTLADGFGAGSGYIEHEKDMHTHAAQVALDNAMAMHKEQIAQQTADQLGAYQRGQVTNDANKTLVDQDYKHGEIGVQQGRLNLDATIEPAKLGVQTRGQDLDFQKGMAGVVQQGVDSQRTADTQRYTADQGLAGRKYTVDARFPTDADGNPIAGAGIGSRAASKPIGTLKTKAAPDTTANDGSWGMLNIGASTIHHPASTTSVYALPAGANPKNLEIGKTYSNGKDNARWTGTGFEKVQ